MKDGGPRCGGMNLVAGGHDSYHGKLLHFHFRDANGGQQPDLRGAHVSPFGQDALAALDVMSDGPVGGGGVLLV